MSEPAVTYAGSPATDSWGNTNTFKCDTCMYYVEKRGHMIGRCRRHAPTLAGWPVMFKADWCGDHKLSADRLALKT